MLKINELEAGKIYLCRLSSLRMLAVKFPVKFTETFQGKAVSEWGMQMRYYNPLTGSYQHIDPVDDQFFLAQNQSI